MMTPGPVPRRHGRYFVVAPGTTLPKICIRTGRKDDLVEIEEDIRTAGSLGRILGGLGALLSPEAGLIKYHIHRPELARMKMLRLWCTRAIIAGIVVLILGIALKHAVVITAGFGVIFISTSIYAMLPTPLSIAAAWGGQVFLLKVPPEIVETVLRKK